MRLQVLVAALLLAACGSSPGSTSPAGGADGATPGGDDVSVPGDGSPGGSGSSGGSSSSGSGVASSSGVAGDASVDAEAGAPGPSDGGSTGTHDASPDGAQTAGSLAYMVGIKTNSVSHGPATVQGWLGRPLDVAGTTITTTSYIGSNATYVNASGSPAPLLEVSFPLLSIFGENNDLNDLAKAAAGNYDATYEAMAQALAAWPNTLLSARVGWEFNGNWYAWSNGVGTNATYANYVSAFQHAAKAIRKYNPHALIQWCVAWGQPDPTPYWPGAYDSSSNPGGVDVVSMDFWMTTYAMQKGVKIALSEYGAGSPSSTGEGSGGGLDDGTWTAASVAWINAQPAGFFLWTLWSDDAPADDNVTSGANPAEQTAWKNAWTGTHFGGTWWP